MNSFSSIEKAIEYEYNRQVKIIEAGETVRQETRGWDDNKQISKSQRGKEEAADYRYFPEPDLPPMICEPEWVESIEVAELPIDKFERIQEQYAIKEDDAFIFAGDKHLCEFFETAAKLSGDNKKTANWILSELIAFMKEDNISVKETKVTPEHIAAIVTMINDGTISGKIAKDIFPEVYQTGKSPESIVEEK